MSLSDLHLLAVFSFSYSTNWVVSILAVPGSIHLRMSTVAIKIDFVSISKN